MPNFKLIGGSLDGTLVAVEVDPLPERLQMQARLKEPGAPARPVNGAIYVLHHLHGIPVYVHEDILTDRKIIEILLKR